MNRCKSSKESELKKLGSDFKKVIWHKKIRIKNRFSCGYTFGHLFDHRPRYDKRYEIKPVFDVVIS